MIEAPVDLLEAMANSICRAGPTSALQELMDQNTEGALTATEPRSWKVWSNGAGHSPIRAKALHVLARKPI